MKEHWNVSLNVNASFVNGCKIIGKNVIFTGNEETLYKSGNITVIGNAKIYNELELHKIIDETNTLEIDMPKTRHSLHILVELYRKIGYEDMLELLEGDFSFLLLDYNIYGEESWIYVARDPFGIYPLYSYENPSHESKKVQFELETKQFGFSSAEYVDNNTYRSFMAGNYQRFSHSFKVSAVWKHNYRPRTFYKLPFFSIYKEKDEEINRENDKTEDEKRIHITYAIKKRMKWISYTSIPTTNDTKIKIGVLQLNPMNTNDSYFDMFKNSIQKYIDQNPKLEYVPVIPEMIQNEDNSSVFEWSKIASFPEENEKKYDMHFILQIEYIEKEYPTIITRLKQLLNSNDPYIIRSHFIPMIFAKYLAEHLPEVKHVFLAEPFTYDWIDKKYLERRKRISQMYTDDNLKGWSQIFLVFGIHLYMPFLDRVLIQNIIPNGL